MVYQGIPSELRDSVELLRREFGDTFYSRDGEEFSQYVALEILRSTPGSGYNAPTQYSFTKEAIRDLNKPKNIQPMKKAKWGEKPYTFDPKQVNGQVRRLIPYMNEFVRYFGDKTFTSNDLTSFVEEFGIRSTAGLVRVLYESGVIRRLDGNYRLTQSTLDNFGD